jgi:fumarate reductase subunit D
VTALTGTGVTIDAAGIPVLIIILPVLEPIAILPALELEPELLLM